jgi:IS30 family transposase
MSHKQLAQEQRYQIYALKKAGVKNTEIADILQVHKSTVSREIKRNTGERGYRPKQAHNFAISRKRNSIKTRISHDQWLLVEELIEEDWSPEQISSWLKMNTRIRLSHEWIYRYIRADKQYGGSLYTHLRCRKKRRKKYGSNSARGQIPDRVSIDKRPAIVETRSRIGDWEIDTIIGARHKQAIVSIVDRKTRFTLLHKVERRSSQNVSDATKQLLAPYKTKVLTITADNGKEFSDHVAVSKALDTGFYFAHPYASWERGLNENTNGLIRQYFPKKSSFAAITSEDIEIVMERLNSRPRKCLGFKTPNELFLGT